MPKVLGIDFIDVVNEDTSVVIPLGGIIPVISWPHASGVVSEGGFVICDGAIIPGGNKVSGTTPNLTTGCFLCGSTSSGSLVGNPSSSVNLSSNQMPLHTHGGTNSGAPNAPAHSHSGSTLANSNDVHTHAGTGTNLNPYNHGHNQFVLADVTGNAPQYVDWQNDGWSTWANAGASGGANVPHAHPASTGNTLSSNNPHQHNISVSTPGAPFGDHVHNITISSIGSGAILNVAPKYYDVIYVMRVD